MRTIKPPKDQTESAIIRASQAPSGRIKRISGMIERREQKEPDGNGRSIIRKVHERAHRMVYGDHTLAEQLLRLTNEPHLDTFDMAFRLWLSTTARPYRTEYFELDEDGKGLRASYSLVRSESGVFIPAEPTEGLRLSDDALAELAVGTRSVILARKGRLYMLDVARKNGGVRDIPWETSCLETMHIPAVGGLIITDGKDLTQGNLRLPEEVALRAACSFSDAITNITQTGRDLLTGLANRKGFTPELSRIAKYVLQGRMDAAIVLVDVDYFKKVNDDWSHQEGDGILRQVAGLIRRGLRSNDSAGRWGGEEFYVLVRNANPDEARIAALRLWRTIEGNSPRILDKESAEEYCITVTMALVPLSLARQRMLTGKGQGTIEKPDEKDIGGLVRFSMDMADTSLSHGKENGRHALVEAREDGPAILVQGEPPDLRRRIKGGDERYLR